MSEPGQKAAEDLADLRAALRGLAGLHVDEASGAAHILGDLRQALRVAAVAAAAVTARCAGTGPNGVA